MKLCLKIPVLLYHKLDIELQGLVWPPLLNPAAWSICWAWLTRWKGVGELSTKVIRSAGLPLILATIPPLAAAALLQSEKAARRSLAELYQQLSCRAALSRPLDSLRPQRRCCRPQRLRATVKIIAEHQCGMLSTGI